MTERQTIAITNPCARAVDTLAAEFQRTHHVGSLLIATTLSVNK